MIVSRAVVVVVVLLASVGIGANAVVTRDVPAGAVVVGVNQIKDERLDRGGGGRGGGRRGLSAAGGLRVRCVWHRSRPIWQRAWRQIVWAFTDKW